MEDRPHPVEGMRHRPGPGLNRRQQLGPIGIGMTGGDDDTGVLSRPSKLAKARDLRSRRDQADAPRGRIEQGSELPDVRRPDQARVVCPPSQRGNERAFEMKAEKPATGVKFFAPVAQLLYVVQQDVGQRRC